MAFMVFQPTADLQIRKSPQPPRRYSRSEYHGRQRELRGIVPRGNGTSGVGYVVIGAPSACLSEPWSEDSLWLSSMATCGKEDTGVGGEAGMVDG